MFSTLAVLKMANFKGQTLTVMKHLQPGDLIGSGLNNDKVDGFGF